MRGKCRASVFRGLKYTTVPEKVERLYYVESSKKYSGGVPFNLFYGNEYKQALQMAE